MKISDKTRAVDLIRSGKETQYQADIRKSYEDSAMAKAFLKAGFVDLQSSVLNNVDDYSPHRVESLLKEVERFKNAILAYKKAENQMLIIRCRINPPVGVIAAGPSLTPADLTASRMVDPDDKASDLMANRFDVEAEASQDDTSS